jgi:hypothetical protein
MMEFLAHHSAVSFVKVKFTLQHPMKEWGVRDIGNTPSLTSALKRKETR